MIKKFDFYILREIMLPLIVGLVLISTLLLGDKLYGLFRYLYSGVPAREVIDILLAFIPAIMVTAIPAALLLGISLGLTKLVKDREIQSVNMIGVKRKRIILPYIILGIFGMCAILFLQEMVIPKATTKALRLINNIIYNSPTAIISKDSVLSIDNKLIYIKNSVQLSDGTQELRDVIFINKNYMNRWTQYMTIPIIKQQGDIWVLQSNPDTGENIRTYTPISDDGNKWEVTEAQEGILNLPKEIFERSADTRKTPEEYTIRELGAMKDSGVRGNMISMQTFTPQMGFSQNEITFHFHKKIATPLMALVITILATSLALIFGRNGSFMGMLIAAIVVFCTIVSGQWMQVLVENSLLNPILAAYLPAAVFFTTGIVLIAKE